LRVGVIWATHLQNLAYECYSAPVICQASGCRRESAGSCSSYGQVSQVREGVGGFTFLGAADTNPLAKYPASYSSYEKGIRFVWQLPAFPVTWPSSRCCTSLSTHRAGLGFDLGPATVDYILKAAERTTGVSASSVLLVCVHLTCASGCYQRLCFRSYTIIFPE
jgi:hypothetical protein